eukprot:CAMPEP_0117423452 /NCGR_PEP_ID=MMETSP0758-20121206/4063_1 /TAXON_ID=63605 /ORGANISM="Percolomonas cosmopolitus, Strain AE-1 (ATCC 50343)" /LENGTH=443 /DNA_ID=CAMNT_0005206629 /DNA_START=355 /DNA_END=1686 /DNA_ORIENTATION=+
MKVKKSKKKSNSEYGGQHIFEFFALGQKEQEQMEKSSFEVDEICTFDLKGVCLSSESCDKRHVSRELKDKEVVQYDKVKCVMENGKTTLYLVYVSEGDYSDDETYENRPIDQPRPQQQPKKQVRVQQQQQQKKVQQQKKKVEQPSSSSNNNTKKKERYDEEDDSESVESMETSSGDTQIADVSMAITQDVTESLPLHEQGMKEEEEVKEEDQMPNGASNDGTLPFNEYQPQPQQVSTTPSSLNSTPTSSMLAFPQTNQTVPQQSISSTTSTSMNMLPNQEPLPTNSFNPSSTFSQGIPSQSLNSLPTSNFDMYSPYQSSQPSAFSSGSTSTTTHQQQTHLHQQPQQPQQPQHSTNPTQSSSYQDNMSNFNNFGTTQSSSLWAFQSSNVNFFPQPFSMSNTTLDSSKPTPPMTSGNQLSSEELKMLSLIREKNITYDQLHALLN